MFSKDLRWVLLVLAGSTGLLAAVSIYVFTQLATVRPLLFFVSINGEAPPICGFCVLFGT